MTKFIAIIFTVCITSFYYFPVSFTFLPSVNLKTLLAVIGIGVLGIDMTRNRNALLNRGFLYLMVLALLVSLSSFFAVVYNNTLDYTYVTYVISMFIWLSAAYVVILLIQKVHGKLSVILVCNYLIVVCSLQCIIALMVDLCKPVKIWVDTWFNSGSEWLDSVNRMYGIGAMLDVAGIRFSAVLIMIAYIITHIDNSRLKRFLPWYIVAFIIITVIGNMMARTTSVGAIIGVVYIVYKTDIYKFRFSIATKKMWIWIIALLTVTLLIVIYFYQTNNAFYTDIRFAFEGFFSLVEKGRWEVDSNEVLKGMIVFPETLKTWFIGDGYMLNPRDINPYYIGSFYYGYYKGTDIGYLRFIFYFGIVGLLLFMYLIYMIAKICMHKFQTQKMLFFLLLMLNYIVWLKVSTDIFSVFALFFLVDELENAKYNENILLQ
ncbi:MAG: hypothetical protein NC206_02890 [Bacteroides sp.]|nr:hypothetical protein [Roseburia sp.]MCM1346010.1 hypothetical protein [Bacteroides sp.]MCM1421476.1 hypothetical protein [Bacteroides sp.]